MRRRRRRRRRRRSGSSCCSFICSSGSRSINSIDTCSSRNSSYSKGISFLAPVDSIVVNLSY